MNRHTLSTYHRVGFACVLAASACDASTLGLTDGTPTTLPGESDSAATTTNVLPGDSASTDAATTDDTGFDFNDSHDNDGSGAASETSAGAETGPGGVSNFGARGPAPMLDCLPGFAGSVVARNSALASVEPRVAAACGLEIVDSYAGADRP